MKFDGLSKSSLFFFNQQRAFNVICHDFFLKLISFIELGIVSSLTRQQGLYATGTKKKIFF